MVQRDVDPLTGAARGHILMSSEDAARLGVQEGQRIRLRSSTGAYTGVAQLGQDTEATPLDVPVHPGAARWYREHA